MSRRKLRVLTARERGAAIALAASTARLRALDSESQLDMFNTRRALRAEWVGIANAARLAVARG